MPPVHVDDEDTVPTLDDALISSIRAEALAPVTSVSGWGVASSRGHVRRQNEDAWGHLAEQFFVVADGMGGYAGGQLAARTAVTGLLSTAASRGVSDWPGALERLNNQVKTATRGRGFERAGTAIAALSLVNGVASVANVGDVRVYRISAGRLSLLTTDHTVGEELIKAGVDPAASGHPKGVLQALTRHVGGIDDLCVPAVNSVVPLHGDRLLMVTDGVYRQVAPADIVGALSNVDCETGANRIVSLADDAGGRDNATALVLQLVANEPPSEPNSNRDPNKRTVA